MCTLWKDADSSGGAGLPTDPGAADVTTGVGVPVAGARQPTKFGTFLKFAMPIVQGGLAGGFGGNDRISGSGYQAADAMFRNQDLSRMSKARDYRQQQEDDFSRNLRASQQRRDEQEEGTRAEERGRQLGIDEMRAKTAQGEQERLGKAGQQKGYQLKDTDQGIMRFDPDSGQLDPAMTNDPSAIPPMQRTPSPFPDLTGEQDQSEPAVPQVRLRSPSYGRSIPRVVTNRDAKGVETTTTYENNPDHPDYGQEIEGAPTGTKQPVPRRPPAAPRPTANQLESEAEAAAQAVLDDAKGNVEAAVQTIMALDDVSGDEKGRIVKHLRARMPKARAGYQIPQSVRDANRAAQ